MLRLLLFAFVTGLAANAGTAQTPPSVGEVANYDGLFAAAHTGNQEMIRQLVAAGAKMNARDSRGRTPAHVAAFASEDEALRALGEKRADMNALDGQASDLVTIAAVPSVSRVARW